jgi:type VI protein secretion system component VasK
VTPRSKKQKPRKSRLRRFLFRAVLLALVAAAVYVPLRQYWQRREAARLEETRDELRQELALLLREDPRLAQAPPGGVLIGAPALFTSRLVHQLADGLLQQTEPI